MYIFHFTKFNISCILIIFLFLFFVNNILVSASVDFGRSVIRILITDLKKFESNFESKKNIKTWGTGFFVRWNNDLYIITARHVVDIKNDLIGIIRLKNKETNEIKLFKISLPRNRWVFHPNSESNEYCSVDIAAMKINQLENYEIVAFVYDKDFLSKSYINKLLNQTFNLKSPHILQSYNWVSDWFGSEVKNSFIRLIPALSVTENKLYQQKNLVNKILNNSNNKYFEEEIIFVKSTMFHGNSGAPVIDCSPFDNPKNKLFGVFIALEEVKIQNNILPPGLACIEPVYRIIETIEYLNNNFEEKSNYNFWSPLDLK